MRIRVNFKSIDVIRLKRITQLSAIVIIKIESMAMAPMNHGTHADRRLFDEYNLDCTKVMNQSSRIIVRSHRIPRFMGISNSDSKIY